MMRPKAEALGYLFTVLGGIGNGVFLMRYPAAECWGRVGAGLYSCGNGDSSAALLRARRR